MTEITQLTFPGKGVWLGLADLHLERGQQARENMVLHLLDKHADELEGIVLLGDIFDIWFGYKHAIFFQAIRLLARLKELADKGVHIIYCEGNHDFRLTGFFQDYIGAVICRRALLTIGEKTCYISHGDDVVAKERGYRLLRAAMSCKLMQVLVSWLPVDWTFWLFGMLSRLSGKKTRKKKFNTDRYIRRFWPVIADYPIDYIFSGHTHHEMKVDITVADRQARLFNPGLFRKRLFYILVASAKVDMPLFDILPPSA